jgi:hypothetical protein
VTVKMKYFIDIYSPSTLSCGDRERGQGRKALSLESYLRSSSSSIVSLLSRRGVDEYKLSAELCPPSREAGTFILDQET